MKILMVNKFLYPRGGAETYFMKIGRYYQNQGHQVEYFGMYDKKNIMFNCANEYTTNMDFRDSGLEKILYPFKIIYSKEAYSKVKKVIAKFQPDIIHLNNINFQLTPSIIDAAYELNIPIIQTVHDYQMLCPNHLMFDFNMKKPCEKCLHESKWNCIKGNCIHGSKLKSIIGFIEAMLYKSRKTYEKVDLYICPSKFIEEKLLTNQLYREKTKVIYNFIEEIGFNELMKKEDYVLFFGRLAEEKGFEMFIESCKKLSNIKFKIAGSGPLKNICRNINNIEFVGFKTGDELNELVSKAMFSVYPSIWYENCPLSVLESQSLGTPVVATKMGGIPELIEDGETGIVLNEVSEKELKQKIKTLYDDKELLNTMVKNCINKKKIMITLDNYCSKLMELYISVLGKYKENKT